MKVCNCIEFVSFLLHCASERPTLAPCMMMSCVQLNLTVGGFVYFEFHNVLTLNF